MTEARSLVRVPFSLITKPTGAACNLDCSYCFFLSKEVLWGHDDQRMSAETLDRFVRSYLDAQPDTANGEPGLNYLCAGYYRFFSHAWPAMDTIGRLIRTGRPTSDIMETASASGGREPGRTRQPGPWRTAAGSSGSGC